jgi:hypothetical protein
MIKNILNKSKLINITKIQKHPFHVLSNSKLPIFTATISGSLALIFIAKLHNLAIIEHIDFSYISSLILDPLFSIGVLSSVSYNLTVLFLLTLLICVM